MQKATLILILVAVALIAVIWGIFFIISSSNKSPDAVNNTVNNSFDIQGVKVEILSEGVGEGAKEGDRVTTHYVGTLQSGVKFDSSRDRNAPFTFELGKGKVIKGWDIGIVGMKVGEKRIITIPPELGYKSVSLPKIPANSTLIFEVELLKVN